MRTLLSHLERILGLRSHSEHIPGHTEPQGGHPQLSPRENAELSCPGREHSCTLTTHRTDTLLCSPVSLLALRRADPVCVTDLPHTPPEVLLRAPWLQLATTTAVGTSSRPAVGEGPILPI